MEPPAETIAVREVHRLDLDRLEEYLESFVPGFSGPLNDVRQFAGGQSNPTYYLATGEKAYVLRRKPPGKLLPSAHAVDREFRVTRALGEIGFPVARTYALCEDPQVVGTPFYVMDYVAGRVLRDPLLGGMEPSERRATYEAMADVLARLHQVDYETLGLGNFGKPGQYIARQIHRWTKQYRASETEPIAAMDRLIEWLPANLPQEDETTLVHGDYRLENVIFHASEPRVLAVLDWELSTLGHPLGDLAYNCMLYHLSPGAFGGFGDAHLEALGIPTEEEYVALYCHKVGREPPRSWSFYMAYALFRIAAILQGIMGRVKEGTASAENAASRGAMAPLVAQEAWALVERR